MKKWIFTLGVIIFFVNFASAYYINGEIRVDEEGLATFNLNTDYFLEAEGLEFNKGKISGKTEDFSGKKNGIWTFSLNGGEYKDIFLDVKLPKNVDKITAINGNEYLFDTEEKILTVIDSGKLEFEVSYKIREIRDYTLIYYLLGTLLILLILFFFYKKKRKRDRLDFLMPLVNENEQKIIDLLMKGKMRQKDVRKKLDLRKASFSRYVSNMEKKKLIVIEGEGKNKVLRLK